MLRHVSIPSGQPLRGCPPPLFKGRKGVAFPFPDQHYLRRFARFKQTMNLNAATASYIHRCMHQRARGEAEGGK